MDKRAVRITAVAASAQLGGTERVLLDFAARAFEHDLNLRVLTPRDGPLIAILNEIGVPAQVVPASERMLAGSQRAGHLWSLPGSIAGLIAWARALDRHEFFEDADAIYTVAFKAHLAVAWLRRHPAVWHLHEYPPALTGTGWRVLSRYLPDAVIANSEATARAWMGRATVVPNGVDLDRFHPRPRSSWIHERLGIPRSHRIVGMPAVFARWKGQIEVIKAFSAIRNPLSDVHLVFVGGSIYDTVSEREYGDELVAAISGERIHLLPFQPKIELVYPEFDLVLHYSLRPEPFGRVILEAMASGVPVIAIGNTHYRAKGFTLDPNSWESYFDLLDRVLSAPDKYRLSKIQVERAWEYAYRFFFEYPFPFPWHLVHLWTDVKEWPVGRVLDEEGQAQFGDTLRYLVGETVDWTR